MSAMKRFYEDNFDKLVTYSALKAEGLDEDEIYNQWEAFSNRPWKEFKNT